MLVSTRGRYALRVMVDLAEHKSETFIPLQEIADRQEISEKYLESIVAVLSKAGLVHGVRGKGGGYKLAKHPRECTVAGIIRLTDGTLAPVACLRREVNHCPRSSQCKTLPMWIKLDRLVNDFLEKITLEDLVDGSLEKP